MDSLACFTGGAGHNATNERADGVFNRLKWCADVRGGDKKEPSSDVGLRGEADALKEISFGEGISFGGGWR